MATNKKVQQTPILEVVQESEKTASESVSVAKEKTSVKKTPIIAKSRRKTSLEEFAFVNNLRPEVKAGFKAWLKGQYFHFDEEWNTLFEQYKNRTL